MFTAFLTFALLGVLVSAQPAPCELLIPNGRITGGSGNGRFDDSAKVDDGKNERDSKGNGQGGANTTARVVSDSVVKVDGSIEKAKFIYRPKPKYPPEAVKAGIEGTVHLRVVVRKDGTIKKVKAIRGESMLVKAATEAVARWRFKPIVIAGKQFEFQSDIYVKFEIPRKRPKKGARRHVAWASCPCPNTDETPVPPATVS
jgi:TonB family protein